FQRHWSQGTPVVITDIEIQGNWTPEYFIKRYGDENVTVENCETDETVPTTVMEFFLHFGKRTNIMKLKDWPPEKDFSTQFPEFNEVFNLVIPFPDLTRWNGVLNLASHFPLNGISPDLGHNMYNADGSMQDDQHHGSTKLHMDITDALNLMVWAAKLPDGSPGYAIWHIFPAAISDILRQFLRE
ncbi:hypothetical protein PILCRDRAFT_52980, partial [Piloderma croceum F 1598]